MSASPTIQGLTGLQQGRSNPPPIRQPIYPSVDEPMAWQWAKWLSDLTVAGVTGSAGTPGPAGPAGPAGQQGSQGNPGTQGIQGTTGLANFVEDDTFPAAYVTPEFLWQQADEALFVGVTGIDHWVQVGAGSAGATGLQGATGLVVRNGTLTFSVSSPIGAVPTGIMGQSTLTGNILFNNWTLLTDATSTVNVDVQKSSYANYPAVTSMHGSTGVHIASSVKNTGDTAYWTGATGAAGDVLRVSLIGSDATASKVSLNLEYSF